MTAAPGVEVVAKDWFEGWAGAPRLGLDPVPEKQKYGTSYDPLAKPTGQLARWQKRLLADYSFTVQVRLAFEFLHHFKQIPEWEDAAYITLGQGRSRKAPTVRTF